MIANGEVRVNKRVVTEMGFRIRPTDVVHVGGHKVHIANDTDQEHIYLLLNKPPNHLTTTKDDRGRKTVMDLIAGTEGTRIYPVGRLDFDAEGALLLTNDGQLAHKLTHPRFHVPKTYLAKVKGVPTEAALDKLRQGIYLDDGPTKPAHVELGARAKVNSWVEITVTEGRNRLIKRMFWRIRHPVLKLVRLEFAGLSADNLRSGQSRPLTKREVARLKAMVN